MIKSPLRYPGGKSRAVKTLFEYIPPGTKTLCSPFFGGGSFEIFCAQKGIKVYGYDYFEPLVDFWQWLLKDPQKLADAVAKYKPGKFSKKEYEKLRKNHPKTKNSFKKATEFYVLNRTSYSGNPTSVGMAKEITKKDGEIIKIDTNPRFTKSSIDRIRNFKVENLSVEHLDFKKSINKHKKDLLYLDPPYLIEEKLYGFKGILHEGFDHQGLVKILKKRKKWILSYNNSDKIREMYDGFQFVYPKWTYGMTTKKNKKSSEILILSNDMEFPDKQD